MKIFVFTFRGNIIGDSIKETALFAFLKQQYPKAKLIVTGASSIRKLYQNNPHIARFIEIPQLNNFDRPQNVFQKLKTTIRALGICWKAMKGMDLCVLTQKHAGWFTLLPKLRGIRTLKKEATSYTTHPAKIYLDKQERDAAKKHIQNNNKKKIAINTESKDPKRWWSKKNYQELINRLTQAGYEIYLLGTDNAYNASFEAESLSIINLVGKTSIRETAAVMEQVDLYIGNDSGLTHISAAVNTSSITILLESDTTVLYDQAKIQAVKLRKPSIAKVLHHVTQLV